MKQIFRLLPCLLWLAGCNKETHLDCASTPGRVPVHILLHDSAGRNLLEAPARYNSDSVFVAFPASGSLKRVVFDTVAEGRAVVIYQNLTTACSDLVAFWTLALLRLTPTDTDTLTADLAPDGRLSVRYNGRPEDGAHVDSARGDVTLSIRK